MTIVSGTWYSNTRLKLRRLYLLHSLFAFSGTSYVHYSFFTNQIHYIQVHVDLGIAYHVQVCQDKRVIIAQSVDYFKLGYYLHPAMSAGWFKYIGNAYRDGGTVVAGPAMGASEGPLLLPD